MNIVDYWTLIIGPKFSKKERAKLNLSRFYAISAGEVIKLRTACPLEPDHVVKIEDQKFWKRSRRALQGSRPRCAKRLTAPGRHEQSGSGWSIPMGAKSLEDKKAVAVRSES